MKKLINNIVSNLRKYLVLANILKRAYYKFWLFMTNKKFDLQFDGDLIERNKFDFINEHIPNYQYLWSTYVGHNGNGYIWGSNLDLDKERKRKEIASLSYSIMQNLVTLQRKMTEINTFVFDVTNADSHLILKDLISGYVLEYGKIVDRQEKMLKHFLNNENVKKQTILTDNYKATRNFIQHDTDVTIISDELGVLGIPIITEFTKPEDVSWFKEYNGNDIVYIIDYVEKSFVDLTTELNTNINKTKILLDENWRDFKFVEKDSLTINQSAKSGNTFTIVYSPLTYK
jgi:hypothetical protein